MAELLDEGEQPPEGGFVAVEANCTGAGATAVAVTAAKPLALPATSKYSFELWSLAPRMPSGWALLGECSSKWVPVSTRRFDDIADDSTAGLSARVKGPPGETVTVCAVAPKELKIQTVECLLPPGGVALASFGGASSATCAPVA